MGAGELGNGTWLGVLGLLKEKVGYPWTTMPEYMFAHVAAGYGGHGTLCGVLGVCSALINMVAYDEKGTYVTMIDRLMYGYAQTEFPTNRFDDISSIPKQVKTRAMSPLCHTSVSKWSLAAGTRVNSKEKKERCAKVTGEVVYQVVSHLNEYFDGKWTPPQWSPREEIAHCWKCHGSDDMWHDKVSFNNQQGHMDCLLCHQDHTKKYDLVSGTPVGAIHACFVASTMHEGTERGARLAEVWESFALSDLFGSAIGELLRLPRRMLSTLRAPSRLREGTPPDRLYGLLDSEHLERIVREAIPWSRIRRNLGEGRLKGACVAATEIATGRSTVFLNAQRGTATPAPGSTTRAWSRGP